MKQIRRLIRRYRKLKQPRSGPFILGMTRIRNESLIIEDSIRHAEEFCDGLIVYDDCSDDHTPEIVEEISQNLLCLIKSKVWSPNRVDEETRHRALLMDVGRQFDPHWFFYFDADERVDGDLRALASAAPKNVDGFRIPLLDAYLAPENHRSYQKGEKLAEIPRMWGLERRDILMLWRNNHKFFYEGRDRREPEWRRGTRLETADVFCKHFGKGISVDQWERTCEYYMEYFPEPYKSKWASRRGKAIHHGYSDFGTALHGWDEAKRNAIKIYPES